MNKQDISFTENGKFKSLEEVFAEMDLMGVEKAYDLLLKGKPLTAESLSQIINKTLEETKAIISTYGEVDQHEKIVGLMGITLVETSHKLSVGDQVVYTWCAADTLLFPRFLGFSALVESKDPINNELVKLSVKEDYLEWTDPVPLYISWMEKADSCDIRNSFCSHSHFFASDKTSQKWLEENPAGKISKVEDFFSYPAGIGCC